MSTSNDAIINMLCSGMNEVRHMLPIIGLKFLEDKELPIFQIGYANRDLYYNANLIDGETYISLENSTRDFNYQEVAFQCDFDRSMPTSLLTQNISIFYDKKGSREAALEALDEFPHMTALLNVLCIRLVDYYSEKIDIFDLKGKKIPTQIFSKIFNKRFSTDSKTETPPETFLGMVQDELKTPFLGEIRYLGCNRTMMGLHVFVRIHNYVWTGFGFSLLGQTINLPSIPAISSLQDLGITPAEEIGKDQYQLLTERGQRYVDLVQKPLYGEVDGYLFFTEDRGYMEADHQLPVRGKFMSDTLGMNLNDSNSEYTMNFGLGDASNRDSLMNKSMPSIPEAAYYMTDAYLYGMSMSERHWGKIRLQDFTPFEFSRESFDDLILPGTTKKLLLSMIQNEVPSLDAVSGKGHARVFLLSGPPGCGKTMTAEACSDLLARPLYSITVGELGTSSQDVEEALTDVSKLARRWNAVVLLDEVDVFAAKRATHTIESNAITAVFLRVLERFEGVLFMTTNLKSGIDPAFLSRCMLNLEYRALTQNQRLQIWKNVLKKAEREGMKIHESCHRLLPRLARMRINGREIKNMVRVFYASAKDNESTLIKSTIQEVLSVKAKR